MIDAGKDIVEVYNPGEKVLLYPDCEDCASDNIDYEVNSGHYQHEYYNNKEGMAEELHFLVVEPPPKEDGKDHDACMSAVVKISSNSIRYRKTGKHWLIRDHSQGIGKFLYILILK